MCSTSWLSPRSLPRMSLIDRLSDRLGALLDEVRIPDRLDRKISDAEHAVARREPERALALLDEVEQERPGIWRVALVAGLAHEQAGDLQRASARLAQAVTQRDVALVRLALGRVAEQLGDLRTAREHFEAGIERRPDELERTELLEALASLHAQMGYPARGVPALRQLVRARPNDPDLALRLAEALIADHDADGALDVLRGIAELDPPPAAALRMAGTLYLERSGTRTSGPDLDAATASFQRILARTADHPDALEGLGRVAQRMGRVADALPLYQEALTTAPLGAHARLHRRMGECYLRSEDRERALDAFRAALALDADDTDSAMLAASAALDLGHGDEADEAAQRALAAAPDDPLVRALAGRAKLMVGDLEAARALLSTLRAARMPVEVLHALGELALHADDPIEGIALLREAIVLQPGRWGVQTRLEAAYASLTPELPPLDALERLDPSRLAPFLDALSEAVASHPLLSDLIPRTTALRQHLDTPLTVAVLGEFNAGKSTLINAFVGEEMVAMGVLPTTSHVNVIRYGPRRVARWTKRDGAVEEIPYAEAGRLVKQAPDQIARLEFCFPHPDLRSIHFWDTPGFNAPDDAHEARAQEALRTADAVVWMIDANQALTMTEFERLATIPSRREKLLVVLNKVDRLGDDAEARGAIEAHVRGYLGDALAGLFFLSTREALAARRADPDAPVPASSGWPRFTEALQTQVFDRAGRLKSLEVIRGLRDVLELAVSRTQTLHAVLGDAGERMRAVRAALTTQQSRWEQDVTTSAMEAATHALRGLRVRTVREVAQLATPQPGLFARNELRPADRDAVKEQLVGRAEDAWGSAERVIVEAADGIDQRVVGEVEGIASGLSASDARGVRRRLEAWLAETSALRRLLHERAVAQPTGLVRARVDEVGDMVLERLGADPGRTEAERESRLHRLVVPAGSDYSAMVDAWGAEYVGAARRLGDHVERDLDILALDLEQRILRPFEAVLAALQPSEDS